MAQQGRITKQNGGDVRSWDPDQALRRLSHVEARFSRGFLAGTPTRWFENLEKQWTPLFHFLESTVSLSRCVVGLDLPPYIERQRVFEIDGEPAILGLSTVAVDALVRQLAEEPRSVAADLALEYLERRFLSSLVKSWAAGAAPRLHYLSDQPSAAVDVVGVISLTFQIGEENCTATIGLGPRAVEKLDLLWRKKLLEDRRRRGENILSDQIHVLSIDITELAVPPAMLIDYMRSGTLIDLEIPVSSRGLLRLDGKLWAEGEICQYNGNFAFAIKKSGVPPRSFPEGTTRVRVELARVEIDYEGIIEHEQKGAVLLTPKPVEANASLVISGENVAAAVIYEIAGNFGLSVLTK